MVRGSVGGIDLLAPILCWLFVLFEKFLKGSLAFRGSGT